MRRIFIFLYTLFVFMTDPLTAMELKDKQNAKNDLHILELLPNLLCPLAVDPGIPADFIALSSKGALDLYDWTYWGPEDVLKAYFEDPSSLKAPILKVKLSANVAQTGPNSFNSEESLKELKKECPIGFAYIETQWGDYPVLAVRTTMVGQLIFQAWVGLNDPNGWTLVFNLVYPDKKDHPSKDDCQLWKNFIKKTTMLKDGDYFRAYGQDLQEGFTLVNIGGAKVKMIAEKRQSDGMLQVVVIPESSSLEFQYVDMIEGLMGAEWKYGEPMIKVYGNIEIKIGNATSIIDQVTSIFFKTVPEFSVKKESENGPMIFQKIGDKAK